MNNILDKKSIILFDGVCNLCNSSVQYVIKNDKNNRFVFAALQSNIGLQLMKEHNIDPEEMDSILLYREGKGIVSKSTAALLIAKKLGFPIQLLSVFLIVPHFIRNSVYDYVAKNRYKWYGKQDSCWIPTPELKEKFID